MKLGTDPRLPVLNSQDYQKNLYARLYDIFRSHAVAVNAVDDAGTQNTSDIATNTAAIAQNTSDIATKIVQATESTLGVAKIATLQETESFSDDLSIVTPQKLGSILNLEGKSVTQSATFAKATNNLQATGLPGLLGLEVGDVISVSGAGNTNDGARTVESITDANNLILNYEHRNGAGSLSLLDQTTTVTIKLLSKWWSAPLGLGQAWVNLTANRALDITYTNSTGRLIKLSLNGVSGTSIACALQMQVNGLPVVYSGIAQATGASRPAGVLTVPAGSTYLFNMISATIVSVWELR